MTQNQSEHENNPPEKGTDKCERQFRKESKEHAKFLEELKELELAEADAKSSEIVFLPHGADSDKVAELRMAMQEPDLELSLRVLRVDNDLYALEGTHRLHVAAQLNIVPLLLVQNLDMPIATDIEVIGNNLARTYSDLVADLSQAYPLRLIVEVKELE